MQIHPSQKRSWVLLITSILLVLSNVRSIVFFLAMRNIWHHFQWYTLAYPMFLSIIGFAVGVIGIINWRRTSKVKVCFFIGLILLFFSLVETVRFLILAFGYLAFDYFMLYEILITIFHQVTIIIYVISSYKFSRIHNESVI